MQLRELEPGDWEQVWPFFERVVQAGETFPYDLELSSEQARAMWLSHRAVVAVDDGRVLGTANCGANRGGNGRHVATASFLVDPAHSGRGVGRALVEHVLGWATGEGFRAITFNAVVETNAAALHLYDSLGFRVVGTVPESFDHPVHGLVGLHVLHRWL